MKSIFVSFLVAVSAIAFGQTVTGSYIDSRVGNSTVRNAYDTARAKTTIKRLSTVGNLVASSFFSDLSAFQTNGGYSVAGGSIVVAADASQANYLRYPQATAADKWSMEVANLMTGSSGGTRQFKVELHSINTTAAVSLEGYAERTAGTDYGKAVIYDPYNNLYYKSAALPALDDADSLVYTFSNNRQTYTLLVRNITKGTSVTATAAFSMMFGQPFVAPNVGRFGLTSKGTGTYRVSGLKIQINSGYGSHLAIGGDSEIQGFYAGGPANRVGELIGAELFGGGGDKTADILNRLDEIITANPDYYIMEAGLNDIFNGVSTSTYIANIQQATNLLRANGIKVIHTTVSPANGNDVTGYVNAMLAYDPAALNLFTLLKGSGTGLSSTFDAGDGVHWNATANLAVANLIKAQPFYDAKRRFGYLTNTPIDTAFGFNGDGDVLIWGTAGNLRTKLRITTGGGSGNMSGNLSANTVPVASGATTLTNSVITSSGQRVGINRNNPTATFEVVTNSVYDGITIANSNSGQYGDPVLKLFNTGSDVTTVSAPNTQHPIVPSTGMLLTDQANGIVLTGSQLRFKARSSLNPGFVSDLSVKNGRVGIGKDNASAPLDIVSAVNSEGLTITGVGTAKYNDAIIKLNNNDGSGVVISNNNAAHDFAPSALFFYTSQTNGEVHTAKGFRWKGFSNFVTGFISDMALTETGNLGIGTDAPTSRLDIDGASIRIRQTSTPTGSSDTSGFVGEVRWDGSYIYWKTVSGWRRTAGQTW